MVAACLHLRRGCGTLLPGCGTLLPGCGTWLPGGGTFLKWRGGPLRESWRQLADNIIRPPNFKAEKTMKEVVINMCEVSVGILYCDVIKLPMCGACSC